MIRWKFVFYLLRICFRRPIPGGPMKRHFCDFVRQMGEIISNLIQSFALVVSKPHGRLFNFIACTLRSVFYIFARSFCFLPIDFYGTFMLLLAQNTRKICNFMHAHTQNSFSCIPCLNINLATHTTSQYNRKGSRGF